MQGIGGIGGGTVGPASARGLASQPGFAVPQSGAARAEAPPAVAAVALPGLLALQEAEGGAARDRRARRHGEAVLDALRRLQLALLGQAGAAELHHLRDLVERAPEPDDTRLAWVQRSLLVRVAVELARRPSAVSA